MRLTKNQRAALGRLTAFERSVLLACLRIPRGQTRTYSQIARQIGNPRAWRAVGNALAKNPLAPLIPCHRVIRSDGKIGGYSKKGGQRAKSRLLLSERLKRTSQTNI
ncbi:MAG: MGMT family protein [Candidatus Micrarchaeota archaeon]|nr:MGMT family protein [Candidatus Micrarchaeota archaeon]